MQRRITARIWLRCFASSPKFPFGELQIRSKRQTVRKQSCSKGYEVIKELGANLI
jgi:hypothetical protein